VTRDPAVNEPCIAFRRERETHKILSSGYAEEDPRRDLAGRVIGGVQRMEAE
jgi:hypothetical protein